MLKLLRFGLALTATFGIASTAIARPAAAMETDMANRALPANETISPETIAGLAILGTGAAIIAYSAKQGNHLPQFANHSTKLQEAEQANPQLQKKLLRLLHNDRDTASRLLARVRQTHPDRSSNWVIEKVIYDLERDRNRH